MSPVPEPMPLDLGSIRARLAAATPGPWYQNTIPGGDTDDGPDGSYEATGNVCAEGEVILESRADKRPTMSDIQGAGAFEQVAAGITGIYRPDYHKESSQSPGEVELIILKSRHDQTGTAKVRFISDWTLFTDLPQRSKP